MKIWAVWTHDSLWATEEQVDPDENIWLLDGVHFSHEAALESAKYLLDEWGQSSKITEGEVEDANR